MNPKTYTSLGSSIGGNHGKYALNGLASAMIPKVCKECFTLCFSHDNCLKNQDFNLIVEQGKAIAKLKQNITSTVPHFKGIKKWLKKNVDEYYSSFAFSEFKQQQRFLTITYDPRKFSFNELTQPVLLINYLKNVLLDLQNLFKEKPNIIIEYHKTGIPHCHINYTCNSVLEHATLILRLRYYFSESLRNKKCIHDRMANENCYNYMIKANAEYFSIKNL